MKSYGKQPGYFPGGKKPRYIVINMGDPNQYEVMDQETGDVLAAYDGFAAGTCAVIDAEERNAVISQQASGSPAS